VNELDVPQKGTRSRGKGRIYHGRRRRSSSVYLFFFRSDGKGAEENRHQSGGGDGVRGESFFMAPRLKRLFAKGTRRLRIREITLLSSSALEKKRWRGLLCEPGKRKIAFSDVFTHN